MAIDYQLVLMFGSAFFAMMATTFLRGFQNKNVAGGFKLLAFICGSAMTALEGLVFVMIAKQGTDIVAFTALGSGIGWVLGMIAHEALMYRRMKAMKIAKKTRRLQRLDTLINERVEEILKERGVI